MGWDAGPSGASCVGCLASLECDPFGPLHNVFWFFFSLWEFRVHIGSGWWERELVSIRAFTRESEYLNSEINLAT